MSVVTALRAAWRKNEAELRGLFNGALPDFVTAVRPAESLLGVPVFCYHLVEADQFEADLEHLARNGYPTVRGRDFVAYVQGRASLPPRAVLLTFDDGAANFHEVAFPLLARYRAHATAFIAPGLHAAAADEEIESAARPMTWEEIGTIYASGLVEFQSHTLESRFVPDWPRPVPLAGCRWELESSRRGTPLALQDDLVRSRRLIEKCLPNAVVNQLAFPMYLGTAAGIAAARAAGIDACYWGLRPGRALNVPGDSPFHVSRLSDEFVRRLPGAGRISVRELLHLRMHRVQAGRAWRRRQAG